MLADLLAPWLLTYLLHSTLLLGAAWLATRLWQAMPEALQESLWRTALLGGVLTAGAQMTIGWEPWSGQLAVPALETQAALPQLGETPRVSGTPEPTIALDVPVPGATELRPTAPALTESAPSAAGLKPAAWLGLLWLGALAFLLVRSHRSRRALRARLAARVPVLDPALRARLDALCKRARVRRPIRLSQSSNVGSPVALGILAAEIVVPDRAPAELSPEQLEVMLAHELAHHVRQDPLWFALTRLVTAVLCFQPLNHLARRRLRETSELLSDAWAAEQTGRGRELAECLTTVAGWMLRTPSTLPAMAAHGSMLELRVERLLDGSAEGPAQRRRGLTRAGALIPLLLVAVFAPVVATGAARETAPETVTDVPASTEATDTTEALALLDREIAALETEAATLLDLLAQVANPPEALRLLAARLENRLTALEERRVALARDAKESNR